MIIIGGARLLTDHSVPIPEDLAAWCRAREETGCTTVLAAWDDEIRGAFAVTDTVARIGRRRGRRPAPRGPAAGAADRRQRGHRAGRGGAAGIGEISSEALPADKARVITELQTAGRSVAMVGDGVDDGPALAAARRAWPSDPAPTSPSSPPT